MSRDLPPFQPSLEWLREVEVLMAKWGVHSLGLSREQVGKLADAMEAKPVSNTIRGRLSLPDISGDIVTADIPEDEVRSMPCEKGTG